MFTSVLHRKCKLSRYEPKFEFTYCASVPHSMLNRVLPHEYVEMVLATSSSGSLEGIAIRQKSQFTHRAGEEIHMEQDHDGRHYHSPSARESQNEFPNISRQE